MLHKIVRPDSKGRITLGALAQGISGFCITQDKDNKLILEPYVEIPAREKWLFDNKIAFEKVKRGLEQAAAGQFVEKGSFAKYLEDGDDE